MDIITPAINFLIDLIVEIITFILDLLPATPFDFEPLEWGAWGDSVGTFIPIGAMATHFTIILSACFAYYIVRWALRLIRMIQ